MFDLHATTPKFTQAQGSCFRASYLMARTPRGQFVALGILAASDTVYVTKGYSQAVQPGVSLVLRAQSEPALSWNRDGKASRCPDRASGVHFLLTVVHPTLCAVSYTTELLLWLHPIGIARTSLVSCTQVNSAMARTHIVGMRCGSWRKTQPI